MAFPKSLLDLRSLQPKDIDTVLKLAARLKRRPAGTQLRGKNIVLIFAKPSTRTRVSFEVGINQLGGSGIYLESHQTQLGRGESVADTARVLSRYCNAIVARLFAHEDLVELAKWSTVPVINGLTDSHHPCQVLADLLTIQEHGKKLAGLKLAFFGDGDSNIAHSLMEAATKMGIELTIACPKPFTPAERFLRENPTVRIERDPLIAAKGADVLYTDVWVSMGDEAEAARRERLLRHYQVNGAVLALAKPDCLVMHDLPAHRGKEITDEVMDGARSVIFDQAENRLHTEKALLLLLLGKA